jgi:transposase
MSKVPRYQIVLTAEEREELERMTRDGKTPAKKFQYARALLLCDKGTEEEAWKVSDVADSLGVTSRTIEHLKKRFAEGGLEGAFERKTPVSPRAVKFDGEFEARLIALACTEPPEGRARWTVQLLTNKMVELNYVDTVSPMTVYNTLKKTNFNLIDQSIGRYRLTTTRPL